MIEDAEPQTEDMEHDENAQDQAWDGDGGEDSSDSSDDGELVDSSVQYDMDNLQDAFPGFREKYRLLRRIGEGTTVGR